MNISACIITNNNPQVLKAIESVYDSVSEIILVNTCKNFDLHTVNDMEKVKVYSFKWCDDFAKARNYSISKATGDWILIIDSDEVMTAQVKYLDSKYDIYLVKIFNGDLPYWNARIFKNDGKIIYKYKLHESVEYCITKENTSLVNDLTFVHSGCQISGQELIDKVNRNLRIMLTDFENPVRNFHLGLYYQFKEDYKISIEYFLRVLNDEVNDEHKALACNNAFKCFLKLGSVQLDLLRQSLEYFPEQRFARVELVSCMIGSFKKEYDETLKQLIITEIEKIKTIDSKLNNDLPINIHLLNEKQKEIQQWL